MKGKKESILVLLLLSVILIAGCTNNGDTGPSGSFVGGDSGLEINFVEDEPPERVLDDNSEQFFITISLKNKGEHTIESGRTIVTLSGISKDQFSLPSLSEKSTNPLDGVLKERNNAIDGGQDEISFTAKFKENLNQDFMPKITANVCYAYGTRALSNLCLRRDVVRREQTGECIVDEEKTVENSGAPVQVTSLKERRKSQNEVTLIFEIQNKGTGRAYGKTAFTSGICGEEPTKEDNVNVEVRPVSKVSVRCDKFAGTSSGVVRLNSEGKTTVSCDVSTSGLQDTSFEEPLNINLDYVYKEQITKEIIIENAI